MLKLTRRLLGTLMRPPLLVIVGPTASGKSSLAVELALELARAGKKAEIISADSRQIYEAIPIFSGAISRENQKNITHHMLGSEDITDVCTAGWFRTQAQKLIRDIQSRGAVPIIVGGSGFWIQGVICEEEYPQVPPDQALRSKLETYSTQELQEELARLDLRRSEEIDIHNRRRLIRSIEIATALGEVPPMKHKLRSEWEAQIIYCNYPKEVNDERIRANVGARLEAGMIEEAKRVYEMVSAERFEELGLAYKHMQDYWSGEIDADELQERIAQEEIQYAKRQRTFFAKMIDRLAAASYTITKRSQRKQAISWALGHYLHS